METTANSVEQHTEPQIKINQLKKFYTIIFCLEILLTIAWILLAVLSFVKNGNSVLLIYSAFYLLPFAYHVILWKCEICDGSPCESKTHIPLCIFIGIIAIGMSILGFSIINNDNYTDDYFAIPYFISTIIYVLQLRFVSMLIHDGDEVEQEFKKQRFDYLKCR